MGPHQRPSRLCLQLPRPLPHIGGSPRPRSRAWAPCVPQTPPRSSVSRRAAPVWVPEAQVTRAPNPCTALSGALPQALGLFCDPGGTTVTRTPGRCPMPTECGAPAHCENRRRHLRVVTNVILTFQTRLEGPQGPPRSAPMTAVVSETPSSGCWPRAGQKRRPSVLGWGTRDMPSAPRKPPPPPPHHAS